MLTECAIKDQVVLQQFSQNISFEKVFFIYEIKLFTHFKFILMFNSLNALLKLLPVSFLIYAFSETVRQDLHTMYFLPMDRPYFRRLNKFNFPQDRKEIYLTNTHEGLPSSGGWLLLSFQLIKY